MQQVEDMQSKNRLGQGRRPEEKASTVGMTQAATFFLWKPLGISRKDKMR